MIEGTLSNILIVEGDKKLYFVEDKKKRPISNENKNSKIVNNRNKSEVFEDHDLTIGSPIK